MFDGWYLRYKTAIIHNTIKTSVKLFLGVILYIWNDAIIWLIKKTNNLHNFDQLLPRMRTFKMWFCWEHCCQLVWMINKWFVTVAESHFDIICSLHCSSDNQVISKVNHLMKQKWCLSTDHLLMISEQTARQSRSLRQMLSTNKFSTRKWSLWNDTTKLNNWNCVFKTEIFWLTYHSWSAKSLTQRRRRSGYVGYIGVTEVRGD